MSGIPPILKEITPFIQRAEELKTHDPLVAYYSRLRSVEIGIQTPGLDKVAQGYLAQQMGILEAQKKALKESDGFLEGDEAREYVLGFVTKLFDKADKIDRSGKANKTTAMTFYAANVFLQVLEQFGALDEEETARAKYSKWKAADIMKAIRLGETPKPGSFQQQLEGKEDSDESYGAVDDEVVRPPLQDMSKPVREPPRPPPEQYHADAADAHDTYKPPPSGTGYEPSIDDIDIVKEYCKLAVSSMDFEDFGSAISFLQKGVRRLQTGRD